MPKYIIPVNFEYYGTYEIEAENLDEAVKKTYETTDFPNDMEYSDGSQEVNWQMIGLMNESSLALTEADWEYLKSH